MLHVIVLHEIVAHLHNEKSRTHRWRGCCVYVHVTYGYFETIVRVRPLLITFDANLPNSYKLAESCFR